MHSCGKLLFSATFCASNCYSVLHSVHQTVIQGLRTRFWHLRTHFWSFRLQFLTLRTYFWSFGAQFWPSILVANRQWMQFCRLRTQFGALWTHFWGLRPQLWPPENSFLKLQNSILGSQSSSGQSDWLRVRCRCHAYVSAGGWGGETQSHETLPQILWPYLKLT